MIKQHLTAIIFITFTTFPFSALIAEDDSCEIKKNNHEQMDNEKKNEFTKNNTWRFKVDNNLLNEKPEKNKISEDTSTTEETSDSINI